MTTAVVDHLQTFAAATGMVDSRWKAACPVSGSRGGRLDIPFRPAWLIAECPV